MKKSNWLILAVLTIAAGFFLWLWYYLGFNFVDDPFDLVLAVVWWAVIVALVAGIRVAEKKREKRVRTAYIASDALFNSEAGVVGLDAFGEGTRLVDVLERTLAGLRYSFGRVDLPDGGTPAGECPDQNQKGLSFNLIVRSDKFDKDDVEKWEGEVVDVKTKEATPFKGKEELARLLAA